MADGWFVRSARDAQWVARPGFGTRVRFEDHAQAPWPQLGLQISIMQPGDHSTYYHAEVGEQEGFLVLEGSCLAIVEEQEIPVRQWDYVHCPSGTRHVFVNDSGARCVLLMVGTRNDEGSIVYPASEAALRHGAGVPREVTSAGEAYAGLPPWSPVEPGEL